MNRRVHWSDVLVNAVALGIMLGPLLPDARTRWYLVMRACQHTARRAGELAITAENRYRKAL